MERNVLVDRALKTVRLVCEQGGASVAFFEVLDHLEKLEDELFETWVKERKELKKEIADLEDRIKDAIGALSY